jgi:hypothetical protein
LNLEKFSKTIPHDCQNCPENTYSSKNSYDECFNIDPVNEIIVEGTPGIGVKCAPGYCSLTTNRAKLDPKDYDGNGKYIPGKCVRCNCTCPNGKGATGENCPIHLSPKCVKCKAFYGLNNDACEKCVQGSITEYKNTNSGSYHTDQCVCKRGYGNALPTFVATVPTCGDRVRLVNGDGDPNTGRVEVRDPKSSAWGTICDDLFDEKDAKVICKCLGKPYKNAIGHHHHAMDRVLEIYT